MARLPSLFSKVRELIAPHIKPVPGGNVVQQQTRCKRQRSVSLPHDEPISRWILGDRQLTQDLCEISNWSPEAKGVVEFLSNDPFQQIGGETGSWHISPTRDGSADGPATHPDVLAIGRDLASRLDGRNPVLGGDRLQSPLRNALFFGDGFSEFEIGRDGLGEYGISRLVDHPPLQVYPCFENGKVTGYELKNSSRLDEPIEVPWWKMLHLSHQGRQGRCGVPLFQAQVDTSWRPLKGVAEDLLDVIRTSGVAPWVHIFGKDMTIAEIEAYRNKVEVERETRILPDLFLSQGGSVRKAPGSESAIDSILQAAQHYRTLMIPAGIPAYLFPGLEGGAANKDLSSQPALAYARKISSLRSLLGEQIKWAITMEIVLKKGFDFFQQEGQFEIAWGKWFVTGMESDLMSTGAPDANGSAGQRLNQMMAGLEQRYQRLVDLDNVGRVIEEVSREH